MWADVLMKLLQEAAFRTMRVQLMNCAVNYEEEDKMAVTIQNHVACTAKPKVSAEDSHQTNGISVTAGVCWT
jgi:hypothetical protein